jgi:hypothetical protein
MPFQVFVIPLRNATNSENPILSVVEIKSIFSSLEVIRGYNSFFLEKLKERIDNWSETQILGDLFLEVVRNEREFFIFPYFVF